MRLPTASRSVPPDSDRWPDEPDEPDPEARWGNPEEDLVSVPSVETRAPESGSEGGGVEIDAEVARLFWAAVVYANVAVAGVTIGPLLVAFRGQLTVGGVAIVGVASLLHPDACVEIEVEAELPEGEWDVAVLTEEDV